MLLEDGKEGVTANCFGFMMTRLGDVRMGRHDTDGYLVTAVLRHHAQHEKFSAIILLISSQLYILAEDFCVLSFLTKIIIDVGIALFIRVVFRVWLGSNVVEPFLSSI